MRLFLFRIWKIQSAYNESIACRQQNKTRFEQAALQLLDDAVSIYYVIFTSNNVMHFTDYNLFSQVTHEQLCCK